MGEGSSYSFLSPAHLTGWWRYGGGETPEVKRYNVMLHFEADVSLYMFFIPFQHTHTHAALRVPWGRADTDSQPEGRRPRTSEGVRLLVQWRRSNPEPVAAASAPPVDCPWTAGALPGSVNTQEWVHWSRWLTRTTCGLRWTYVIYSLVKV